MKFCKICNNFLFPSPTLTIPNSPNRAQFLSNTPNDKGIIFEIYECSHCGTWQSNGVYVDYYQKAITTSQLSKEMQIFRFQQLKEFKKKYQIQNSILDIGSSVKKEICFSAGFKNYSSIGGFDKNKFIFFPPSDSFICCNYFEHYPFPNEFLHFIKNNNKSIVGILEVPNLDMILEKRLYSEFIPDHIFYFSEKTLTFALNYAGFEVLEKRKIRNDYILSFIVAIHNQLPVYQSLFNHEKNNIILNFYNTFKNYNKIAIYGAGHQAFSILSYLQECEKKKIVCVIDDAPFKQEKYTPATNILITSYEKARNLGIEAIIIIGGSYSQEILNRILDKIPIFIFEDNKLRKI